jgi:elongation factor Ts
MEITASAVKDLRIKTGLPMMDCKKALTECGGDEEAAIQWLRERGAKVMGGRADRETAFGRFGIYAGLSKSVGGIVELKCESDPVAKNEEFVQLAQDLAQRVAETPKLESAEQLLQQPSPSQKGKTLGEQRDELMNRIREVFNIGRFARLDSSCGGYSHNSGTVSGVLLAVEGGSDEAAKDVCMHIAAMRPSALTPEDLDPQQVEKERQILREQSLKEGKPANIVDKMVEGRLRSYYAEQALLEQPFVKDQKQSVGQYATQQKMKIKKFIHWELGQK